MAGYSADLACIHEFGFSEYARNAARLLLAELGAPGLVVDLGCGGGTLARNICDAGYEVLGVDISPSMIRLARKNAPRAKFVVASLLTVELPACDAVTCIGECINYLFDPRNNVRQVERLFRRVYNALRPGGIFIFDVAEPGQPPSKRFVRSDNWVVLSEAVESGRLLTRHITSFVRSRRNWRRIDETHRLRLYDSNDLKRRLRSIGFHVADAELPVSPRHAAIIARKPS